SSGPRRFDATAVADLASNARTQRRSRSADPFLSRLDLAADQFVVRRANERPTVIAGYPWFTDWGRDTMISLPGLLLARGLLAEAREVLRGFLAHVDCGLIPNAFPDRPGDKPEYNTVDATLWMFQAVHAYVQASGDARFLREEFYPAAKEIVRWHRQGTHHGIKVDPADELLAAGAPGVQLTWMDARVGDRVITPRHVTPAARRNSRRARIASAPRSRRRSGILSAGIWTTSSAIPRCGPTSCSRSPCRIHFSLPSSASRWCARWSATSSPPLVCERSDP